MSDFTDSDLTVADKAIWLDGVKTGKQREINRIIKLLEEQCVEDSPTGIKILEETTLHHLIALIKGENK